MLPKFVPGYLRCIFQKSLTTCKQIDFEAMKARLFLS